MHNLLRIRAVQYRTAVCSWRMYEVSVKLHFMAFILPAAQYDLNLTLWAESIISNSN